MELTKDYVNVPLCDLTLGRNQLNKSRQQSTPERASKRISNMRNKKKKEVESDSSWNPESSEDENNTPEKERKVQVKHEETSEGDEVCDYEKMIQQNRERSKAFLQSLNLDEVKESFCKAVNDLKPKRNSVKIKRPAPSSPPVRRKSRRLAKQDVDLSEEAIMKRAVKEGLQEYVISEKPKELPQALQFEEALKGEEIFSKFVHDFSELDYKKNEKSYDLVSHMKNMQISESQVAKVVRGRITAMDVHPVLDKIVVVAGDKYGHIGLWNMNCNSNPYVFGPHLEGVSCLKVNSYDPNEILSSSYDGTFRCGDMNKHVFKEVHRGLDRSCCTYLDVLSKTTFIVAHRDGNVAVVDNRNEKKSVKNHTCHDYSIKTVCIHPVNKNYFITSEIKGTIRLWDLRKLQKKPVADIKHHRRSASSAFFSPVTGNSILSTSLDDSLCVFDSSSLSQDISLKKNIKHNNFTGRWLSIFRAIWAPNSDDTFVVGSMNFPRRIEVLKDDGKNIHNFMGDDLTSITSLLAFHPTLPVLAGGNSSGKVFVFTDQVVNKS